GSIRALNPPAAFDAAARTLLAAGQVGFLGTRSAFGIAHQMRYAYQLVRRNGLLIDGLGGAPAEQIDNLQAGDALAVHGPVQGARVALETRGDASIAADLHATRDGVSLAARNATLAHARVIATPPAAQARPSTPAIDIARSGTLTLRGTLFF
ncbi:hypothetical protein, partial [Klebsiella pneumoniae]|uniref:hypothetical protein n=1 Tax=Klebsiella pneumoniae TaxID=573 RepID=UPI001CDA352D